MVFPWCFFEIGNTYFFCKTSALTSANYAADINYYGVILFLFIFLLYDIHCIKQNKMVVVVLLLLVISLSLELMLGPKLTQNLFVTNFDSMLLKKSKYLLN